MNYPHIKLTLILCLTFSALFAQNMLETYPEVADIVAQVDASLNQCQLVRLENEQFMENLTDGGGSLTGYYTEEEGFRKIELRIGLSNGISQLHFYFEDEELVFVSEVFDQFEYDEESDMFNYTVTEQTFKGGYVFKDVFDYVTLGHNRFDDHTLDPGVTLADEAIRYMELLYSTR